MQLTFSFSSWHIETSEGILGRQYDNLAHQIVVVGSLPEDYTWDMLVECRGNYNVIPLTVNSTGASATLTADQLALSGYYDFQLRGTQNSVIHHTNSTQVFIPDTIVGPGTWPVLPTEFSEAEAAIKELNAHPPTPGENGYWMIWDLDTHAYVQSDLPIPGLTMQIGDTITGEPGTDALVENVGTPTAPKLQFTIPRGDEGKAATIEVGEVTASDPGSEPQVTNTGTENAAVLDFVLPRGQTGPTGQAATVEVESTITGQPGTQASVENVGTTGAAKLRFTIPQGAQGVQGNPGVDAPNPQITVKETSTLPAGSPATVEVEGESPNFELSFGIPQGPQGAQGVQGEQGIQGAQGIPGPVGPTGATPNITMQVTGLEYDQEPTVSKSGTPEEPVFTLGIPQGQPGQDGVQINDEAVNTTETWSSKKLLDTLCPPFTETGNPITCNPVEDYPLDVTVTMEPIQEGTGDPSPDNVRPISGWDSVKVTVSNDDVTHDYDVTLPETICGGTVDTVTGAGSKEWFTVTLTGDEKWTAWQSARPSSFFTDIAGHKNLANNASNVLCNSFVFDTGDNRYTPYHFFSQNPGLYPDNVRMCFTFDETVTSTELAKQWLATQAAAGTPVTICYKLATPEPFQATGSQPIPALAGENTVYTDGDSLTVSGRTDPLSTIQTMQAQITALQDQATQGGTA